MPEAVHVGSGKVREIYELDDERLLLVASDRISTFDVVLPTEIPDKGRVLTGLSGFWFARTREIVPNHLLGLRADGRSTEARRLDDAPDRVRRARLPGRLGLEGLPGHRRGVRAPAPGRAARVRPAPGADLHAGDEGARGPRREHRPATARPSSSARNVLAQAEQVSIALYEHAAAYAAERGIIIADTKFELGLDPDGVLTLGDEALTPDSSRFWPADEYEPGRGAAVVRQAVRPRLLRVARMGQDPARPGAPRRRWWTGHAPATWRRSSA